eukprot:5000791-Pyramimonas_sp.AAC.1
MAWPCYTIIMTWPFSATLCYATALLWHGVLRARYRNEDVRYLVSLLCCAIVLLQLDAQLFFCWACLALLCCAILEAR